MAELIMFLAALMVPDNITVKIRDFQKKLFSESIILPAFGFDALCPLAFFGGRPEIAEKISVSNCRLRTGKLTAVRDHLFIEIPDLDPALLVSFIYCPKKERQFSGATPFPVFPGIYLGKLTGEIPDNESVSVINWNKSRFALLEIDMTSSGSTDTLLCRTILERKIYTDT